MLTRKASLCSDEGARCSKMRRNSHDNVVMDLSLAKERHGQHAMFHNEIRRSFSDHDLSRLHSQSSFGEILDSPNESSTPVSVDTIASCFAQKVHELIVQGENFRSQGNVIASNYDTFCSSGGRRKQKSLENDHSSSPLSRRKFLPVKHMAAPPLKLIIDFIAKLCNDTQMEYECIIISLIYIRRLIKASNGNFVMMSTNWKGVVLSCVLLSNKVWDDFHMRNIDYSYIFNGLSVRRVNELEMKLLQCIDCSCNVSPILFAQTHFEIQDMMTALRIDEEKVQRSKMSQPLTKRSTSGLFKKNAPVFPANSSPMSSEGTEDMLMSPSSCADEDSHTQRINHLAAAGVTKHKEDTSTRARQTLLRIQYDVSSSVARSSFNSAKTDKKKLQRRSEPTSEIKLKEQSSDVRMPLKKKKEKKSFFKLLKTLFSCRRTGNLSTSI